MAQPAIVSHTGSLSSSPSSGSIGSPSLQEVLNTSFSATYGVRKSGAPTINGATTESPFVLDLETIVSVRMIGIQVRSGSLTLRLTSADGTLQNIPISSLFLWHGPASGDQITAIRLVGTGDIEYSIAGDPS